MTVRSKSCNNLLTGVILKFQAWSILLRPADSCSILSVSVSGVCCGGPVLDAVTCANVRSESIVVVVLHLGSGARYICICSVFFFIVAR